MVSVVCTFIVRIDIFTRRYYYYNFGTVIYKDYVYDYRKIFISIMDILDMYYHLLDLLVIFQLNEFFMEDKFIQIWQETANDLKLEIIVNFSLNLSSGHQINTDLLLLNFGDEQGMLIVRSYEKIKLWLDEINEQNYGFSVLSDLTKNETYVRSDFIELLKDWEWTGQDSKKPDWL